MKNDDIEKKIETIDQMIAKKVLKNRLEKININIFRKFITDTEINFIHPLTVLTGKNGSGKTSVMKMIEILKNNEKPQYEFFETEIDDAGLTNASFEFILDNAKYIYKRVGKNKWTSNVNQKINKISFAWIKPKVMIGAVDKSLLYDSIGKNEKKDKKVEYIIKQSKKMKQNNLEKSQKKIVNCLSPKGIIQVNKILQKEYVEIKIIKHKYFSGTWGATVIFNDGVSYSEYNAGSGEFLIVNIVNEICKMPKQSIILLDEPETSLHPGAQKRLMNYILNTIIEQKLQYIISTHSTYIVNMLPKECLKCFRILENGLITIEENVLPENAFIELEADIPNKKHIIVEDDLAKEIILAILEEEDMKELCSIDYYSGGADNIKVMTIPVFSKIGIKERYIIFDGDQFKKQVPNFSQILESEKTIDFYKKEFFEVTGVESKKIKWGVDANRKEERTNVKQEIELIQNYLKYYSTNVYFLPCKIPEDIIFNIEYIKNIFNDFDLKSLDDKKTGKQKIKYLSDNTIKDVKAIEKMLIYNFIKKKDKNYNDILEKLKRILTI